MRRLMLFLTISVFLFSGIIQGPVCNIIVLLDLENDGFLSALKFDTVAWAAKPGKPGPPPTGQTGPPPPGQTGNHLPEPSTAILLGAGIVGAVYLLRKKRKK